MAGHTDFDANDLALHLIMNEWTSQRNFQQRVQNVVSGQGMLAGSGILLNEDTVHDDEDRDELNGQAGRNLFFFNFEGPGIIDLADYRMRKKKWDARFDLL